MNRLLRSTLTALSLLPALCQAQGWLGYGGDPQHTAISKVAVQPMKDILWSVNLDLSPPATEIHYGTMLVTPNNTVVATIKTGQSDSFKLEGHRGRDGALLWTFVTDYSVPTEGWIATCGSTLTPQGTLVIPGAGGTIYIRSNGDSPSASITQVAFFGMDNYQANPAAYNQNVKICTPITSDCEGNVYFGYQVLGATPINLQAGIARVTPEGFATSIPVTVAADDASMQRVPTNCAPALSNDGTVLYIAAMDGNWHGYLLGLNACDLQPLYKVRCKDPRNGGDIILHPYGTQSPTVGPDGDVYYGGWADNRYRGFLNHYDATLTVTKTPGAFGWDDTASIVPRSCVPSYTGTSSYLVLTKYNDYLEGGGSGENALAILDPNATEIDPISGATVMKEVLTVLGPTHDPRGGANAVTEWCINTAAVDPATKSAVVNNEDGVCYRWNLVTNTLTEALRLTNGVGEAYTPTAVGPDGTAYLVNNMVMFAVSKKATVAALEFNPPAVAGGTAALGTVRLNVPAPTGGANVLLSNANPAVVTVPSLVKVPVGQYTGTFVATTFAVSATQSITITATRAGTSVTQSLTVTKIVPLTGVSMNVESVAGGNPAVGTVTMAAATPAGGANVLLSSSNPSVVQVPSSVNVAAGAASANFALTTSAVSATTAVTVTASRAGVVRTVVLTVSKLVPLKAVSLNSPTVASGGSVVGTVEITSAAPVGGANVALSSSNPAIASVPSLAKVNAGQTSGTFTVTAHAVACDSPVSITATRAGITRSVTLTVLRPVITAVQLSTSSIVGGNSLTGTVVLSGVAPTGGVVVYLLSSDLGVATVPVSVKVDAGQTSASFSIATLVQSSAKSVTISGTKSGVASQVLQVTP